ncbi:hypothetical protein LTR57_013313 [Friedmanniomyces endolithicus]|nr:hypothetical protein LTR57_013313 [Friedmanniomyces endolithicus]
MPISKKDRIHREHPSMRHSKANDILRFSEESRSCWHPVHAFIIPLTRLEVAFAHTYDSTPVNPNGTPVKVPKSKSICAFCRKELESTNLKILEQHATTHPDPWTKEKCWPKEFA